MRQETTSRSAKRRQASSAGFVPDQPNPATHPLPNTKGSNPTSGPKPNTASLKTTNVTVAAFEEAVVKADETRKQDRQASRQLLQKIDTFIQELEQQDLAKHPEVAQASTLIQHFSLEIAHALANGNITNLNANRKQPTQLTDQTLAPDAQPIVSNKHTPTKPQPGETWATIASRNSPSKHNALQYKAVIRQKAVLEASKAKTTQQNADNRLFIWLDLEHNLRQLHPHYIQKHLSPALDGVLLSSIHIVPSCLALQPKTEKDATTLNARREHVKKLCGAKAVETADPWTKLRLPRVPRWFNTLAGRREATIEEVTTEIV